MYANDNISKDAQSYQIYMLHYENNLLSKITKKSFFFIYAEKIYTQKM